MNNYPKKVSENILPFSVAGTLPEAFKEWSFTEKTIDHEEPVEICQLCEHEELRYHFEITNAFTKKSLWVGSQCILKFGLSVFDSGQHLSPERAKRKLDRLTQHMRLESCIKALEKLALKEQNTILDSALEYYKKNKCLTPKFAFIVLWRLQENDIDHSPSFFKVNLKKDKYQQDLREMPSKRVHIIWSALSVYQRRMAIELGHSAPLV